MKFEVDKQTIKDLEIFTGSIFDFYDKTKTFGGKNYLRKLIEVPLTDIEALNDSVESIRFLVESGLDLELDPKQFDFIEHYLKLEIPSLRNNIVDAFFQNLSYQIKPSNDYYLIQTGIRQLLNLFFSLNEKIQKLNSDLPRSLREKVSVINSFIQIIDPVDLRKTNEKVAFANLNKLDNLFREKHKEELKRVIKVLYSLDAYISIADTAKQHKLAFPEYVNSPTSSVSISKLYHPLLKNAVPYDLEISESNNVCFLTGPNMAGKSTFLKSLGLAIYISHLGFPVPAEKMTTTVYQGIMTTINLSDDRDRGYSHFYSEVKRVKEVALKLKEKKRLFVIFDELFRGTNVKDAYDASLLIIESFSRLKKSTFFISTHITEVAEKLNCLNNIQFKYFDSKLVDNKPIYEYKIREGVSHERLGLHIVKNEKIVEILNSIHEK